MRLQQQTKSTKDRILDAAFSFFLAPRFAPISLSDIAKKTGISKAAIFRHFKNKNALFTAMQDIFVSRAVDYISSVITSLEHADWEKDISLYRIVLRNAITVFFKKPEFLFYMMFLEASSNKIKTNLQNSLENEIKQRGMSLELLHTVIGIKINNGKHETFDIKRQCSFVYCVATICFFSLYYFSPKNTEPEEKKIFTEKIADLIDYGIKNPEHQISAQRMKEINKMCTIEPSSIPPLDPIFKALSNVVEEYGFPGVTVERIATKLGMAKSSLYTYFDTKNGLISNLLHKEMNFMVQNIIKTTSVFSNQTEIIYAFLRVITNFFLIRPEVLTVFKWTRMTGTIISDRFECGPEIPNLSLKSAEHQTNQFDLISLKITQETFFTWLSVISSSLSTQMRQCNWTTDNYYDAIEICFNFIQKGLTNGK